MTVEATPRGTGFLPESADGWSIDVERNVATMTVVLDPVTCEVPAVEVAPVDPVLVQATCEAAREVTLAETSGITYTGLPEDLVGGETFTITAIAGEGYVLSAATGWELNEDGTATKQFTLADAPSDCEAAPTTPPTEEQNPGEQKPVEQKPATQKPAAKPLKETPKKSTLAKTGADAWLVGMGVVGVGALGVGGVLVGSRRRQDA